MADILGQLDKIKTWVDENKDDIGKLKESLGDGHDLVKTFMNACISGKPELAKEALTEFADVNELIINEAELAALGTGPDFMDVLSVVWKGVILVAKVAAQVNGLKGALDDADIL
jgi:hypothetical protein